MAAPTVPIVILCRVVAGTPLISLLCRQLPTLHRAIISPGVPVGLFFETLDLQGFASSFAGEALGARRGQDPALHLGVRDCRWGA